jgi:hypothetical protein
MLHIEMAAAQTILDEIHKALPRYAEDSNTYILRRIKQHNVIIMCLLVAQYRINNAVNVIINIKQTFSAICAGLLVRISSGMLSKADVHLGDVVIRIRVI